MRLKWPNDLMLDGRKAAGSLSEVAEAKAIVGIGINLTWAPPARQVDQPAIRLLEKPRAGLAVWSVAEPDRILGRGVSCQ